MNEIQHKSEQSGEHDLELSVRGANTVKRVAGTVGELVRLTEDEFLSTRCFGESSLKDVKEALAKRGLRFGMSTHELRGRTDLHGKIVAKGTVQQVAEAEHEHACCGHCDEAARKLRERTKTLFVSESGLIEDAPEYPLDMNFAELELSMRVVYCLESEGISSVRELVLRTAEELLEIPNFGPAALREVMSRLKAHGLRLGMRLSTPGVSPR